MPRLDVFHIQLTYQPLGRSELVMSLCQSDIAYDAPEWLTGEHMTGMFIIDMFKIEFVHVRIQSVLNETVINASGENVARRENV